MNDTITLSPEVEAAIEALGANLLATQPFLAQKAAFASLRADTQATELLQKLAQTEATLRERQANGALTQEDIIAYRTLQAQVNANPLISAHEQAQQATIDALREVNATISQVLGVDFASLAASSGCC